MNNNCVEWIKKICNKYKKKIVFRLGKGYDEDFKVLIINIINICGISFI